MEVRSLSPQAQSFERVRNDQGGFTRRLTEKRFEIKSDVFGQNTGKIEIYDLVADGAGICFGIFVVLPLMQRLRIRL